MGSHMQTLRIRSSRMSQWMLFLIRFVFSPRGSLYQQPAALSHPPEPCCLDPVAGTPESEPWPRVVTSALPCDLGQAI